MNTAEASAHVVSDISEQQLPILGPPLKSYQVVLWAVTAVAAFSAAYEFRNLNLLILLYLFTVLQIARGATWRRSFYPALGVGLAIGVIHLEFFWNIFSAGAVCLWLVFAFWIGLFAAVTRALLQESRQRWALLLPPMVWCGLEYFRSELYYLRFSWASPGYSMAETIGQFALGALGVYGTAFLLMIAATLAAKRWKDSKWRGSLILVIGGALFLGLACFKRAAELPPHGTVQVAGVQMEFPSEKEVLVRLSETVKQFPKAELVVLSEYTFQEPIPEKVKSWCRDKKRFLIAGGREPTGSNYYNTAFVVSPAGEIVFRQVKAVPIQFFKDGLPAPVQHLWESPWGKLGICICYDLSYRRITDPLVKLGAQALIVPTMDVVDWGERQHLLHGRIAPVRSAEYSLAIFRVSSSGVSQLTDSRGKVLVSAPCPGEGKIIGGTLEIRPHGTLPLDHYLAPICTAATCGLMFFTWIRRLHFSRVKGFSA